MSYVVIQQERQFGPLSQEALLWLTQRGLVLDSDRCRILPAEDSAGEGELTRVYDAVNAMPPALLAAWGIAIGRPVRPRAIGAPMLSSLRGAQWAELLAEQPGFASFADVEALQGKDWIFLLSRRPELLSKCHRWSLFTPGQWETLVQKGLVTADIAHFSQSSPAEQLQYLAEQPELDAFVDFRRYSLTDWENLLLAEPRFAERHPEWRQSCAASTLRLQLLKGSYPAPLLPLLPSEQLTGRDWLAILSERPELAPYCHWNNVLDAVLMLPKGEGAGPFLRMKDEALTYHHGQQNAIDSFRELWERRQAVYEYADKAAMKDQLSMERWLLLYDFMGWEDKIPVEAFSRQQLVDILARHPAVGDTNHLWEHLKHNERLMLLRRSPSLFRRLQLKKGDIPRNLWQQLYECARERDDENDLALIAPISMADWLCGDHRNNVVLRNRIFMRWLALLAMVFILVFFTLNP